MLTSLRKVRNSSGVIIPKPLLNEIGAQVGDNVELSVQNGKIILAPSKRRQGRAGQRQARHWRNLEKVLSGLNSAMTMMRS